MPQADSLSVEPEWLPHPCLVQALTTLPLLKRLLRKVLTALSHVPIREAGLTSRTSDGFLRLITSVVRFPSGPSDAIGCGEGGFRVAVCCSLLF